MKSYVFASSGTAPQAPEEHWIKRAIYLAGVTGLGGAAGFKLQYELRNRRVLRMTEETNHALMDTAPSALKTGGHDVDHEFTLGISHAPTEITPSTAHYSGAVTHETYVSDKSHSMSVENGADEHTGPYGHEPSQPVVISNDDINAFFTTDSQSISMTIRNGGTENLVVVHVIKGKDSLLYCYDPMNHTLLETDKVDDMKVHLAAVFAMCSSAGLVVQDDKKSKLLAYEAFHLRASYWEPGFKTPYQSGMQMFGGAVKVVLSPIVIPALVLAAAMAGVAALIYGLKTLIDIHQQNPEKEADDNAKARQLGIAAGVALISAPFLPLIMLGSFITKSVLACKLREQAATEGHQASTGQVGMFANRQVQPDTNLPASTTPLDDVNKEVTPVPLYSQ